MANHDDIAIKVQNLSKTFKLPHEKQSSIKSSLIHLGRNSKGYELQKALEDVSFEVKKGEFFGIVGRNGSGKSTLLKLLAGIYSPTKGTVEVKGKLTPFIELGVGFNPELTGRENVFLNGALLGFNRKEMTAMYDEIVEFAELERFMDQRLKNYSSGMQVRLAFSIAIRAKSDILVLDEVLAVGDEAFQRKCRDYFREIKNSSQTVILVTHGMRSITDYCDRAMLIDNGKKRMVGSPQSIAEAYNEINAPTKNQTADLNAALDLVQKNANIQNIGIRAPSSNRQRQYFKFGEEIEISIEYELLDDVTNGVVDIGIRQGKNGPYFFYTKTDNHLHKVFGKKGAKLEVNCVVKNIFSEGIFYVDTSLYDSVTLNVYARARQAASFRTGSPVFEGAIVYPEHTLHVKERKQYVQK